MMLAFHYASILFLWLCKSALAVKCIHSTSAGCVSIICDKYDQMIKVINPDYYNFVLQKHGVNDTNNQTNLPYNFFDQCVYAVKGNSTMYTCGYKSFCEDNQDISYNKCKTCTDDHCNVDFSCESEADKRPDKCVDLTLLTEINQNKNMTCKVGTSSKGFYSLTCSAALDMLRLKTSTELCYAAKDKSGEWIAGCGEQGFCLISFSLGFADCRECNDGNDCNKRFLPDGIDYSDEPKFENTKRECPGDGVLHPEAFMLIMVFVLLITLI